MRRVQARRWLGKHWPVGLLEVVHPYVIHPGSFFRRIFEARGRPFPDRCRGVVMVLCGGMGAFSGRKGRASEAV